MMLSHDGDSGGSKGGKYASVYAAAVTVDTQIAIDRIELVNDSGVHGDNAGQNMCVRSSDISVPDDVEKVLLSIDGGGFDTEFFQSRVRRLAGLHGRRICQGRHTLTVEVTDGAGNKMTETLQFHYRHTLLTPTIELAPDRDTGQNKNDNLTSVTQPVFVLGVSLKMFDTWVVLSITARLKRVVLHRIGRRLALSTGFCFGGR